MDSTDGGSDDDSWQCQQSLSQRQLVGPHYRQGAIMDDIFTIQVYDIRNVMQVMPVKYETFTLDCIPSTNDDANINEAVAKRYGVTCDLVHVDPQKREAIICDDENIHIVFISFSTYREPKVPVSLYTEQGCVALNPEADVKTLKRLIYQSECFQTEKGVSLFVRGKRLSDDITVESCVKHKRRILCVEEKRLKVQFFHRPRQKTENKYTIECMNVHNVRELKNIFTLTFSEDFSCLQTGSDELWLTQGKHLLKDDDYIFIPASGRSYVHDRGRLMINIKPASSFPVTVKVLSTSDGKDGYQFIVLISKSLRLSDLREEISLITDHHPNALKVYIQNMKVRNDILSEVDGFNPHCTVTVQVADKILVHVLVEQHDASSLRKITMKVYKLDSIQHLKKLVARQLGVDPNDLQMFFEDREILNENLLQNYRIRDSDTIYAVLFHDSIHLLLRQHGERLYFLTVGNFRECKVLDLKRFLVNALESRAWPINIIYLDRCLDNEDTLFEAGLSSGETLLIPRIDVNDDGAEGTKRVFISTPEGSFVVAVVLEKAGILFYAPDSIPVCTIEERVAASQAQYTGSEMMIHRSLVSPPSPRGSTSSTISLQCYRTLLGVSSADSESGKSPLDISSMKQMDDNLDEVPKLKKIFNRPSTRLIVPNHHSDPESSALKRFTMCKEITKEGDKVIFRESSFYEEDVSNDSESKLQSLGRAHIPTSSDCDTSDATSPQPRPSPSLIFPPQVIKDAVLSAVSLELGHSWKRVGLTLGLAHTDLENLEYRHHGNLHEQALQALLLWKQRSSRLATTARLKDALNECGLALVADAVDENLNYDTA